MKSSVNKFRKYEIKSTKIIGRSPGTFKVSYVLPVFVGMFTKTQNFLQSNYILTFEVAERGRTIELKAIYHMLKLLQCYVFFLRIQKYLDKHNDRILCIHSWRKVMTSLNLLELRNYPGISFVLGETKPLNSSHLLWPEFSIENITIWSLILRRKY